MKRSVGPSFSDFVTTGGRIRRMGSNSSDGKEYRRYFPYFALIVCFSLLVIKLFYLQVIRGEYYRGLSDGNRIRTKIIKAERGIIFDRNNKALVRNLPAFIVVQNGKVNFLEKEKALEKIAEGNDKNIETAIQREYVYNNVFAHILGYTGQITSQQLLLPKYKDYGSGDFIGITGVEKANENMMHGKDGKELYEVDANGKTIRILGKEEPGPGQDVYTTLDSSLQLASYNALSGIEKGVIIVSDPNDGGIMAMVSKPDFDPNIFTHHENYTVKSKYKNVTEILQDTNNQPLLNRAIAGLYPPGSTYKLVTAVAALESGKIDSKTRIEDTGVLKVGSFSYGNWFYSSYGKTEGLLDVVGAIKRSNDIFFYKIAESTGLRNIIEMSKKFHLGKKLNIDIQGEEGGLLPDAEWKLKQIGEPWYLGDIYHLGIGQGYLLTTPLQVNFWTLVFANNGILYKPYILKDKKEIINKDFLNKESIDLVRQGMKQSCETGGVAYPFFDFKVKNTKLKIDNENILEVKSGTTSADLKEYRKITVGCKTGTAETVQGKNPHAWFTAFAPFQNPEVVITVLVEYGGEGSSVAAPIAKKVLEEYFRNK